MKWLVVWDYKLSRRTNDTSNVYSFLISICRLQAFHHHCGWNFLKRGIGVIPDTWFAIMHQEPLSKITSLTSNSWRKRKRPCMGPKKATWDIFINARLQLFPQEKSVTLCLQILGTWSRGTRTFATSGHRQAVTAEMDENMGTGPRTRSSRRQVLTRCWK